MLETVTKGFRSAKNRLVGKTEISPEMVDESLRDIRVSLLEADVAFDVVKKFVARVREKAIGEVVKTTITDKGGRRIKVSPSDHFIKICHDELEALMGPVEVGLKFAPKGQLSGVMVVGLQGSGKTTTTGKLAYRLAKEGKRPLLIAADIYRPAAVDQLQILGQRLELPVFFEPNLRPPELVQRGYAYAREQKCDVALIDTAGRLAIDEALMTELEQIKSRVEPDDILLVADAMIGQDAVKTAGEFDRRLSLSGFVLTKLDGDARGGAALSIKEVTGKPVKFVGMGEALDKLEEFRPEGLASRILGFGDIVGLMKDFEGVVDEQKAEEDAEKILTGNFDLHDFVEQIKLVKKMGSVNDLLEKFPLFGELPEGITFDDKELVRVEAMIGSMTKAERKNPQIMGEERIERIAKGSGQGKQHVRGLLDRFFAMQKVMRQIGGGPGGPGMGLLSRLPGFRQLAQLKQMKGMDPQDVASLFGLPKEMTEAMPAAGGKGSHSAALARQRLMGFNQNPPRQMTDEERKKLRDKRKQERRNKKKNRRR